MDGFPRPYGKFELLRRLGDGGMAEVFLARLPGVAGFQKTLVLKRILPHLSRKKHFVDLFVQEASLAAEVRHRNVVQVFELGQVEGELYMAMEYVEGYDLRRLLRYAAKESLRIPPWFTVHVICEVLEALAYAYDLQDDEGRARRVVHRDVTPSNIFISSQGEVKLGDFGVARDDTRSERTRAGQLKGKVAYMAPEQLYSRKVDQRTDLFSVGVVLWECLAQRRLFGGRPDIEMMNAICEGERTPPGAKLVDVPPELDAVVIQALQPKPSERWASAQQMQRALYGVLEKLRRRVTPADVRAVQAGLTKSVSRAEGGLPGLNTVRHDTRTDTAPSFTGISTGDVPSNKSGEVLANPLYGDRGDSVADLSIDIDFDAAAAAAAPFNGLANDLSMEAGSPPPRGVSSSAGLELSPSSDLPDPPATPQRSISGGYEFVRERSVSQPGGAPPRLVTGTPVPGAPTPAHRPTSTPSAPAMPRSGSIVPAAHARPRAPSAIAPLPRPQSSLSSPPPRTNSQAARIIQGQPSPAPSAPVPLPPEHLRVSPGTGDLDLDALVQEAVDDVRSELPEGAVIEQSSLIAGLDSRRLMGDARNLTSDRWAFLLDRELYDGPHPFFLIDHEGSRVGPCSYMQALTIAKLEVKAGFGEKSAIGISPDRMIPTRQALELLGMETLVRPEHFGEGFMAEAEGRTPIRLFADYTRQPISGRLILYRDRAGRGDYREIELLGGEPTFVWTEVEELQFAELLCRKRLLRPENLPELAHDVIGARKPLEAIASTKMGTDLRRYRPMLQKERLVELFTKGYASHTVREKSEIVHTESFAPNLLQIALELTFRCVPREWVSAHIAARSSRKLRCSSDFDRTMSQLSLSPDILSATGLISKGKTLERLLETYPAQRRTLTTLAFFMMEADLIYAD